MASKTLSALAAAALGMVGLIPAPAQTHSDKTKPPAAAQSANASASVPVGSEAEVIGSVNGKPITWGRIVANFQKSDPNGFSQALVQTTGDLVGSLFNANGPKQITITKASVLVSLRQHLTPPLFSAVRSTLAEEALNQEAVKYNLQPTDAQVQAYIDRSLNDVRANGGIPKEQTNADFLKSRGLDIVTLKERLRPQLRIFNLINKDMATKLGHPLGPDDYMRARHILVRVPEMQPGEKPEDHQKLVDSARDKITKIAEEIKSGKQKFEDAAKANSDDPGSKIKGGDLGPFVRGSMVKEFENAAFALKPNEISAPVQSQFGWHLIEIDKLGKDMTPEERQTAQDHYDQSHSSIFMNELMSRPGIVNKLAALEPQPNMMGGPPGSPRPVRPGVGPGGGPPPNPSPNGGAKPGGQSPNPAPNGGK